MQKPNKYTREELIEICENSVVPCGKWGDRDSCSAQSQLNDVYRGLLAGLEFNAEDGDYECIDIYFINITDEQRSNIWKQYNLPIHSLDDYREMIDPAYENEMFEGHGLDFKNKDFGYIPTREKLNRVDGDDWCNA